MKAPTWRRILGHLIQNGRTGVNDSASNPEGRDRCHISAGILSVTNIPEHSTGALSFKSNIEPRRRGAKELEVRERIESWILPATQGLFFRPT